MSYATQTDLTNVGLPANALGIGAGALTVSQINAALQNASDRVDSALRARYGNSSVPLLVWDSTITQTVAKLATFELMVVRGLKANGPDYKLFRSRYDDAMDYINQIQRQQAHPLVTLATGAVAPFQPNLTTSSVVDISSGATSGNRGW